jgi:glucose-6-phosphate isomerase
MDNNLSLWQKYQEWLYYHPGLEFYLDVSRIGFTESDVAQLVPRFDKAFKDMAALEGGAIANPDEGRMVGHYWLRAPQLAPDPQITKDITNNIQNIETFASRVHSGEIKPPGAAKFTDIISIGIGGSALGPQFVSEALAPDVPPLAIHFIDNSDPAGVDRLIHQLAEKLVSTMVIVISKSGSTPEPNNGMLEVAAAFERCGLDFGKQAVAITGIDSKLDRAAANWLARFPMEDWVGGRTSEMSAVGLVPAALQGVDIRGLLNGAREMDGATRSTVFKENPAALLAFCWYVEGRGKGEKDMVVLPYKDNLMLFSRYLQQLVMESLGKELDLDGNKVYQGIAVYGNKGSTDQHAYVQQLREGVPNFFMTFVEVLQDRDKTTPSRELEPDVTMGDYLSGFLQGTRTALYEKGRGSISIAVREADARTIGALIALYERAVGFYASLINVNAYHQPGVEAGKKAAADVLKLQTTVIEVLRRNSGSISIVDLAAKADAVDRIEEVYKIVRHLAANGRAELEGDRSKPGNLLVSHRK